MCWLCSATGLVRSLFGLPVFAICSFARKSRCVGRSRCRGYSSQLARRRGAGGRSLCMESISHRTPARPLWKRSLFWVSRLACMASIMLLSLTLCLVCPGCHAVFTCFQSCPDSLPRYSSVFSLPCFGFGPLPVTSPAHQISRVSLGMSLMVLSGSGPRWQIGALPQLHHGICWGGASQLLSGCSSIRPRS